MDLFSLDLRADKIAAMDRESYLRPMTDEQDDTNFGHAAHRLCLYPALCEDAGQLARRVPDAGCRQPGSLYVGKARNLKARVSNYARPGHSGRIERMIAATASMMFLTTRTETEALLLEQNLIKQLKPKYNVLLRDDKSFPNIPGRQGSRLSADQETSRRQEGKGCLFRPLRQCGCGEPDAEPAAKGVPAAQLLGFHVRQPDAALSAVSDQALFRAVCRV